MVRRALLFMVCVAMGIGLASVGFLLLNAPAGEGHDKRLITIPSGASFQRVAELLHHEGFIENTVWFRVMGRVSGHDRKIMPGEYALHTGMRPMDILTVLVEGQVYYHSVTIPEGYTIFQIAQLLAEKHLVNVQDFIQLTRDEPFIQTFDFDVSSLEGYLFPDTYYFTRPSSPEAIIQVMVRRFKDTFSSDLMARARELNMTVSEVVTLASVIEKETGLSQERSLVSGVFHNRLKKNIPLQSDPTVIYALESFDGNIRKRDLSVNSPYNTYRAHGLPPGPIGNPGKAAILAALYPATTDYVYFVSRNDGSHQFSSTLAEHNRAVEKYQRSGRKQAS